MQTHPSKTIEKAFTRDFSNRKVSEGMPWNAKFKRKFPNATFSKDVYKADVLNLTMRYHSNEPLDGPSVCDSLDQYASLNQPPLSQFKKGTAAFNKSTRDKFKDLLAQSKVKVISPESEENGSRAMFASTTKENSLFQPSILTPPTAHQ